MQRKNLLSSMYPRIPLLIGRKWCRRCRSSIKYGKNAVLNCLIIMRIADIFDDGDDMGEIGENVWVDGDGGYGWGSGILRQYEELTA